MNRLLLIAAPLLVLGAGLSFALAQGEEDANITYVEENDPAMVAAIAEARRTLPTFLPVLADPPAGASEMVIKFPLGGWEHIWVSGIRREGDAIVGRLANAPVQDGFAQGEEVRVPLGEISDWAWRDAKGAMHGHYTTRALLPGLPADQAAAVRQYMGWD